MFSLVAHVPSKARQHATDMEAFSIEVMESMENDLAKIGAKVAEVRLDISEQHRRTRKRQRSNTRLDILEATA